MTPLESLALAAGVAWMTGTIVTVREIGEFSSDSLGVRFIMAFFLWPFIMLGR